MVALGAAYLSIALAREGADARLAYIPHFHVQDSDPLVRGILYRKEDSGPDDYTFRNGAEALRKLVTEAVAADPVARVRALLDSHRSKADRSAAIAVLLRDLPFRAMLYAGGSITVSEVVALTNNVGFGARAIRQAAAEFTASLSTAAKRDSDQEDKRTIIYLSTDEKRVNDEVVAALATDPAVYQRDGMLVTITRAAEPPPSAAFQRTEGTPTIASIPVMGLRERVTELVRLLRHGAEGDKASHPPDWMAAQIHVRRSWDGIRPLTGVVEAPTMRSDGSILQTRGYDPATGLLYLPTIEFPVVPEEPAKEQAAEALKKLRYLLVDYTFAKGMHEAAAVAGLMTPTARPSIAGFAPAVAIDGNKRGIGKTKVVDLASLLAVGRRASRLAYTRDDNEIRKQLTSIVLKGDTIVLVDNVPGSFGSPVWDEFLTSPKWTDRILGSSSMVERAVFVTVYVTGNNIEPEGDIARRTLHARLQTDLERPDTRPASDFKEADLEGYVLEHRAELVVAILTILRAYVVAGSPPVEGAVWGSFESWANRIAKPLIWLGMDDPCESRRDFESGPTATGSRAAALLGSWRRVYPETAVTVSQVLRDIANEKMKEGKAADGDTLLLADAIQAFVPAKAGEFPSVFAIGKRLGSIKDSVHADLRVVAEGERDGTTMWRVERVVSYTSGTADDGEDKAAQEAAVARLMEGV